MAAQQYFRGKPVRDMPDSLLLFHLLQAFPGYTREALEAEDPALVDDWLTILSAQAAVSREKSR